jgi:hypothetical protein
MIEQSYNASRTAAAMVGLAGFEPDRNVTHDFPRACSHFELGRHMTAPVCRKLTNPLSPLLCWLMRQAVMKTLDIETIPLAALLSVVSTNATGAADDWLKTNPFADNAPVCVEPNGLSTVPSIR